MSYIPTPEQALELVKQYNKEAFHIQHAETVGKVMGYIAAQYDPGRGGLLTAVGILHDIDFEQWPEQHCVKAQELLKELDIDEGRHPRRRQPWLRPGLRRGAHAADGEVPLRR